MPQISIQAGRSFRQALGPALDRMKDLRKPLSKVPALIRASVADEFAQKAWFAPDGSKRRWRPLVPFGRKTKKNRRPLRDSGRYFRALMGRGAGAVERVGPRSVVVGVDASVYPYAEIQRGGTGARITTSEVVIRPRQQTRHPKGRRPRGEPWVKRWKMWWRLGFELGVWLTERTLRRGLRLPRRPHMTRNPALTAKIRGVLKRHITRAGR